MTRPQFAPRVAPPAPAEIRAARATAALTQRQSADLVHVDLSAWQRWEAGDRRMPAGLWELYRIKTGE